MPDYLRLPWGTLGTWYFDGDAYFLSGSVVDSGTLLDYCVARRYGTGDFYRGERTKLEEVFDPHMIRTLETIRIYREEAIEATFGESLDAWNKAERLINHLKARN